MEALALAAAHRRARRLALAPSCGNFAAQLRVLLRNVKLLPTAVLAALAVSALATGVLAWRQYRELIQLRGAALLRDERADLQKRIWDLEKANRDLSEQLLAARPATDDVEVLPGDVNSSEPAPEAPARRAPASRRGEGQLAYREAMSRPEVQAALSLQRQLGVEERYSALFRNLNLSPDQAEKLKALLAERQSTVQDIMTVAREQGVHPRTDPEGFRKLMSDAEAQIDSSIRAVIGEAGLAQLQTYEQTLPQRALVSDLQQRLSYSDTPLTSAQAEQLIQILANNPSNRERAAGGNAALLGLRADVSILTGGAVGRGGNARITSDAINQAQGVLAQPQVDALRKMRQQQQAQQQVQQLIRDSMRQYRSGTNAAPTAPRPGG